VAGRQRVAQLIAGLFRRGRPLGFFLRLAWVNGHPGAVMYDAEGLVLSVIELDAVLGDTVLDDTVPGGTGPAGEGAGVIQAIHGVVNPDKLGHLGPVSDMARLPGAGLSGPGFRVAGGGGVAPRPPDRSPKVS
jgi:hypothetical protein